MTPSVASVQRLAFFSLRIPDSELGCDVGSARDPIKRGVVRPRSVTFSSSSMHNRDEIWVAKGRRRAGDGDGDGPGRLTKNRTLVQPPHGKLHSGPDSPGRLTEKRALQPEPHGKAQFGWSEARRMRFSVKCAFPHLGKRRAASRKTALCSRRLTEKRTLAQPPHGKVHSATRASRKSALCSWRLTEKRILPSHLTEKCTLQPFLDRGGTKKRILQPERSRRKLWCMGGGRRRPSPILECRSDQETTERKRRWPAPIG